MMKLVRMMKMVKERSKFMAYINKAIGLKPGTERLILFVMFVMLFTHIMACLWYYLAKLDNLAPDTWVVRYGLIDVSKSEIYLTSVYYIMTTITTVGYGDISGETINERIMCLFLFFFGVFTFSFSIGSLS